MHNFAIAKSDHVQHDFMESMAARASIVILLLVLDLFTTGHCEYQRCDLVLPIDRKAATLFILLYIFTAATLRSKSYIIHTKFMLSH